MLRPAPAVNLPGFLVLAALTSCATATKTQECSSCVPPNRLTEAPQLIGCEEPDAKEGTLVALDFTLGTDGRPERGTIRARTVHRVLKIFEAERSAVERLLGCRWRPARVDGQPVRVWLRYSLHVPRNDPTS